MKYILTLLIMASVAVPAFSHAQTENTLEPAEIVDLLNTETEATSSTSTESASTTPKVNITFLPLERTDVTQPEQTEEKEGILLLLEDRPIDSIGITNILAYWVQSAISIGVPANTIILILLLPVIATVIAIFRLFVGLPSLEMFVPIALAYTFVAIGIDAGIIILAAILFATFLSRFMLKRVRIMQLPKRAISMMILSLSVFGALTLSAGFNIVEVSEISIFPVLMLVLLGDMIVNIQLHKSMAETLTITSVTIGLGLIGYVLTVLTPVRNTLLLYPESLLLLIPLNILIGRYFGLRLTEYFRFQSIISHGSK
jgi:hypothetical protein